jgi:hypothetical protein
VVVDLVVVEAVVVVVFRIFVVVFICVGLLSGCGVVVGSGDGFVV